MATVPPLDPYISKPKVYLVGRQQVADDELARFLADEGMVFSTDAPAAGEALAEIAGRICYMSFGKGRKSNREYLENILASKHGSVLEHAVWCLLITGVSRALTHELVRHRAGFGYSQLSQRYVDESDARYVVPPLYQENPELREKWQQTIEILRKAYAELADATVAIRAAEASGNGSARPAQMGAPGGPLHPSQRHRNQDFRDGKLPRLAALPRTARQHPRRHGNPPAGSRGLPPLQEGIPQHLPGHRARG